MATSLLPYIFTFFIAVLILFQAGLALGLPWGAASMGGKFPGRYPPKMRLVALVNLLVLFFIALIVLSKASLILPAMMSFSRIAIWVVVVFFLASTVMNTITPSKIERIWAPVALILFITSLLIALGYYSI